MDELKLNIGKTLRLRLFSYLKIADEPYNNGYDNHDDDNNNNSNNDDDGSWLMTVRLLVVATNMKT